MTSNIGPNASSENKDMKGIWDKVGDVNSMKVCITNEETSH
jgi:hypothetical protein